MSTFEVAHHSNQKQVYIFDVYAEWNTNAALENGSPRHCETLHTFTYHSLHHSTWRMHVVEGFKPFVIVDTHIAFIFPRNRHSVVLVPPALPWCLATRALRPFGLVASQRGQLVWHTLPIAALFVRVLTIFIEIVSKTGWIDSIDACLIGLCYSRGVQGCERGTRHRSRVAVLVPASRNLLVVLVDVRFRLRFVVPMFFSKYSSVFVSANLEICSHILETWKWNEINTSFIFAKDRAT